MINIDSILHFVDWKSPAESAKAMQCCYSNLLKSDGST